MITQWSKYTFKVNEFHGEQYQDDQIEKADIHAYLQQNDTVSYPSIFAVHRYSLTLLIHLRKTEKELRKEMNRTTRYQINKGAREELKLTYIHTPTKGEIADFATFFNPFAIEKGIDQCRVDKLQALREKNMLLFTYISNKEGKILAAHAYVSLRKRVKMFYSCSIRLRDRDISGLSVSIANRYMHWQNILYFKKQGFYVYDFMGLAMDPNKQGGESLNRFKRGFGGEEKYEYQSFIPQTWKGKLLTIALRFLWRKRVGIIKSNQLKQTKDKFRNVYK